MYACNVSPEIGLALNQLLEANDKALTDGESHAAYQVVLNQGPDYYMTVTVPAFSGM